MPPINKKLTLTSRIQTNQILTNDDEICIPRLSSILLAVLKAFFSELVAKMLLSLGFLHYF